MVVVSWLPFYHDMGLIMGVCVPLAAGRSAVLMSPLAFLRKPASWMQQLASHPHSVSAAPNFAFELAVILFVATRKGAALRAHWLDVAVVVLTVPLYGQLLSSLRFFRFLRLLRAVAVISRAIQAERRLTSTSLFRVMALLTVFLVVVAGAAQATFDTNEFPSMWDGVWWAVVTVTTVGYGDLYPTDVEGRIIGVALMLLGIGFIAVLTGTIASQFIQNDTNSTEMLETLRRIETDVAELKGRLPTT